MGPMKYMFTRLSFNISMNTGSLVTTDSSSLIITVSKTASALVASARVSLEIEYEPEATTVWMVKEWFHPQGLTSASRGGVQRASRGNVLVSWDQNPMCTEYTVDGKLIMDVRRGQVLPIEHGLPNMNTYSMWKKNWLGHPTWAPNISCVSHAVAKAVYVSWNVATEVGRFRGRVSSTAQEDCFGIQRHDDMLTRTIHSCHRSTSMTSNALARQGRAPLSSDGLRGPVHHTQVGCFAAYRLDPLPMSFLF